ncbi:MAG: hypothetical protein ACK5LL_13770 [Suipraeoptans sp.]
MKGDVFFKLGQIICEKCAVEILFYNHTVTIGYINEIKTISNSTYVHISDSEFIQTGYAPIEAIKEITIISERQNKEYTTKKNNIYVLYGKDKKVNDK